jgi:spermidine synthase
VDSGGLRALRFLGESDLDVIETLIDLREPHVLQHAYARAAMGALLYAPEPESCLLIGLGGGAIVRFLDHHFPRLRLDVVEIDPAVVRVAREYFGTTEGPASRFHVADGREFLERRGPRYDLILIDAHLHPDERTDASGHPLSLRGAAFYRSVRERLNPDGIAMFNMIRGRAAETWLDGVRRAFAATHVYRPAGTGNLIVFAADRPLPGGDELLARARTFDRRGGYSFSFERLLEARSPDR